MDSYNRENYLREYENAKKDKEAFWDEKAKDILTWSKNYSKIYNGKFGEDKWFEDGELNACNNCIDRWAKTQPNKIALIFDSNDGVTTKISYKEALDRIIEISHCLKHLKKGDCVTLYLSMGQEAVFSVLACARLGLTHSVVFGGFSSESLRLRIDDSRSKFLIVQDVVYRGEKRIDYLSVVDKAVDGLFIETLIFNNNITNISNDYPNLQHSKLWTNIKKDRSFIDCVPVGSEHPLFYLYTSGSTGKPKGLIHSTGGYLLYVAYTLRTAFDIKKDDVFCCTADIGWITGHSYAIYGPLALGITSVVLEGLPTFPTHYRFYDLVHKYQITQFYTAPTAIRILKKYFETNPLNLNDYNFSSLRSLGSVGEPINKEAHKFYSETFGNKHVVDTYWQTETGGFLLAPVMGVKKTKPECACLPLPGILPIIIDKEQDPDNFVNVEAGMNVLGRIYVSESWPGIARGILNDQTRYKSSYFSTPFYFTGDEGIRDEEGDYWVRGRADDVINVSGHRISTAEMESAACQHENVAEAAVISVHHEIKGQSMVLFVVLKKDVEEFEVEIKQKIAELIGGFCRPDQIIKCTGIPKTATGKIMRRVLRSIVSKTDIGDLSTCINSDSIESIKSQMQLKTALN